MTANSAKFETASEREIVITRIIDAPRERVFEAMTDPKQVVKWWGPYGFSTTIHEMDVRPGGTWRFMMHSPDGVDYPNKIVYTEIVPPERIAYLHGSDQEDDHGAFHASVTFVEQGNKNQLTLRIIFDSKEERDKKVAAGAIEGGNSTLDRLEAFLSKDQ